MKYLLMLVLALAVGGGVWYAMRDEAPSTEAANAPGGGFRGGPSEVPLVTVEPARREELSETVEAIGTAQANESVIVTAKVTDTVSSVDFEDGDYVEEGAILVQLTNQEEEALLAEAQANLEDSEHQLARLEDLSSQGLAPRSELDNARFAAAAAQARFDTVVARLRDRLIRAPFSGVLGFRQVSPGTLIQPTTAITTLDDISTIKLDFTVPETFIGDLTPGSMVRAQSVSYPDHEFEGVVRTIGSRVDPVTRAVPVRAHIPNEDRLLHPGMLLTVQVVTEQRIALVVPESSVFQIQDRAYVYLVGADRIARQHQIEIGDRRFGIVEVTAGLSEGDLVVSQGIIKLRDGARVRYEGDAQEISDSATPGLGTSARG